MKKISELPVAVGLSQEDEWVLPVCVDKTALAVRKISIKALVDGIKNAVLSDGEVQMEVVGGGIKFFKKKI